MPPQLLVPLHKWVPTEDVIDEDVQSTVLCLDARHKVIHRRQVQVIDAEGAALPPGRLHQLAGLLDGLRPIHIRWASHATAAPRRVHKGAGSAELNGDGTSCSAGGAGHQRDLTLEWSVFNMLAHGLCSLLDVWGLYAPLLLATYDDSGN